MSESRFIILKEGQIHYEKHGTGKIPLLIFHGFGQSAITFQYFNHTELTSTYTFYYFDLFFHGASEWWQGETPLEKHVLKKFLDEFLKRESLNQFQVMGFSMGGKFALAIAELFPQQLKKLYLLAPDGIKTSFWYSLATYPHAFRNLFKSMITHHKRFSAIAKLAHRLKVIDNGILRFVESQMNTEDKRRQVYFSWVVFRHLTINLPKLIQLLNTHSTPVSILIGKHDKIIDAASIEKFKLAIHHSQLTIVDTGHNGIVRESIKIL